MPIANSIQHWKIKKANSTSSKTKCLAGGKNVLKIRFFNLTVSGFQYFKGRPFTHCKSIPSVCLDSIYGQIDIVRLFSLIFLLQSILLNKSLQSVKIPLEKNADFFFKKSALRNGSNWPSFRWKIKVLSGIRLKTFPFPLQPLKSSTPLMEPASKD